MGSAPVPGGLSTSLGRAAVADPDTNTWGARIVAIEGTRAAGVDAIVWFADANALVSALAVEIPLWNVDPSSEDDTVRAQNIANIGSRIVAGGGAGPETLQFTIPALQQILAKDATIAWIGWGFIGHSGLALAVTALIAAAFVIGALELQRFRTQTAGLRDSWRLPDEDGTSRLLPQGELTPVFLFA
jgi:hypothetical protein